METVDTAFRLPGTQILGLGQALQADVRPPPESETSGEGKIRITCVKQPLAFNKQQGTRFSLAMTHNTLAVWKTNVPGW
jgi:hypothetical protein